VHAVVHRDTSRSSRAEIITRRDIASNRSAVLFARNGPVHRNQYSTLPHSPQCSRKHCNASMVAWYKSHHRSVLVAAWCVLASARRTDDGDDKSGTILANETVHLQGIVERRRGRPGANGRPERIVIARIV